MALNWSDGGQILTAVFILPLIGYILGWFNIFTKEELWSVLDLLRFIPIPAAIFKEISKMPLSKEHWIPLISAITLQLAIIMIIIVYSYLKPKESWLKAFYYNMLAYGHNSYFAFSYHVIKVIAGDNYTLIPIYFLIVQLLILEPILKTIHHILFTDDRQESSEENDQEAPHNPEEGDLEEIDGVVGNDGNPDHHVGEEGKDDDDVKVEERTVRSFSFKAKIIISALNPSLILLIIGIIWAATKYQHPTLITSLTGDLENSICGSILVMSGYLCQQIKFYISDLKTVIPSLIVKFIVGPLIVGGICVGLGVESLRTKMMVMCAAAPVSPYALQLAQDGGAEGEPISATFLASNVLWVVFAFIWLSITLCTGLF